MAAQSLERCAVNAGFQNLRGGILAGLCFDNVSHNRFAGFGNLLGVGAHLCGAGL